VPLNKRRSSVFSEGLSETHKSLRSSTDDLLLPRYKLGSPLASQHEPSHWHSVPLGLALLPAVGGLLFKDGSALITDITLLALAAIFLNWAVRLPWYALTSSICLPYRLIFLRDWYLSAQATKPEDPISLSAFDPIQEGSDEDGQDEAVASSQGPNSPSKPDEGVGTTRPTPQADALAAQKELQIHESLALSACFLFPAIGAWLLHAIRSQLSRPSEGLVSNYNLTVFLLASEIRPLSHLVKLVQARTLHLQRVASSAVIDDEKIDANKVLDMAKRLEELEAHVADTADSAQKKIAGPFEQLTAKTVAQVTSDMRKTIQPELDALNRAVRRYEKRTTISALQTEARLQELELRLKDVVVLAAAAERNAESAPRNFILILANWLCGAVVLPVQYLGFLLSLPSRFMNWLATSLSRLIGTKRSKAGKDAKAGRQGSTARPRERRLKAGS
jgi:hypothetical protein